MVFVVGILMCRTSIVFFDFISSYLCKYDIPINRRCRKVLMNSAFRSSSGRYLEASRNSSVAVLKIPLLSSTLKKRLQMCASCEDAFNERFPNLSFSIGNASIDLFNSNCPTFCFLLIYPPKYPLIKDQGKFRIGFFPILIESKRIPNRYRTETGERVMDCFLPKLPCISREESETEIRSANSLAPALVRAQAGDQGPAVAGQS